MTIKQSLSDTQRAEELSSHLAMLSTKEELQVMAKSLISLYQAILERIDRYGAVDMDVSSLIKDKKTTNQALTAVLGALSIHSEADTLGDKHV